MQSKSTRGVQKEEVWAAADALIAAGERPRLAKYRQSHAGGLVCHSGAAAWGSARGR